MKIGITGSIGSGKSYICKILRDEYNIQVYDCDAAAKRLMRTDKGLQERLSQAIGKDVFPDGIIDKAAISTFLLASPHNNQTINAIVHPAVGEDFNNSTYDWLESAILFESGFNRYVDYSVCVSAPLEVRINRIIERDHITREKALEWINRQLPQPEKESLSDFVIINDGVLSLKEQIEQMLKTIDK